MKALLAVVLFAVSIAAQEPASSVLFTCIVTEADSTVVTLVCEAKDRPNLILDIPTAEWPEKWDGPREGSAVLKFRAVREASGRIRPLPTYKWCEKYREQRHEALCGKGNYCRPPTGIAVEGCGAQ